MANVKITELTAYTNPASTDVVPIVDLVNDQTKKVTLADIFQNFPDGTAGAPSIAFDGDSNTGIYRPGADQLAISTGGTARLTVSTSAVTSALPVDVLLGSASTPSFTFTGDLDTGIYSPGANQVAISTNGTGRLFIDSSGNVGIGQTNPSGKLEVSGGYVTLRSGASSFPDGISAPIIYGSVGGGSGTFDQTGNLVLQTRSDAGNYSICMVTGDTPTERLRIDSSGNVGIGTTRAAGSNPLTVLTTSGNGLVFTKGVTGGYWNNEFVSIGIQNSSTDGNNKSQIRFGVPADGTSDLRFITQASSGNAAEKARIDPQGRLLVGTSSARSNLFTAVSPQFLLEGTGTANSTAAIISNADANTNASVFALGKTRATAVGGNTIVQNGDTLGILSFNGSDGTYLKPGAQIKSEVDGTPGANDMPGRLVFSTTADGASSPTERMRINKDGIIQTYSSSSVYVASSTQGAGNTFTLFLGRHSASSVGAGTTSFAVYTNGNVENTNNSYGAISDIKLKENIVDANSQWNDLKALQVRNYNFKEGQTHTQIGLIAQEVELVSPGLVTESPDRDAEGNDLGTVTKSVNYSVLYMKAVKALQEAMERIETLEAKVAALEAS